MNNSIVKLGKFEQALAEVKTAKDANNLKADIQSALKQLQKVNMERAEKRELAFNGNVMFCEAAVISGELWEAEENKKPEGRPGNSKMFESLSVLDAGFSNHMDAEICVRISRLDPQDRQLYYQAQSEKDRMPTVNGLLTLYKMFNPGVEDEGRPWLRVYNVWNFAMPDVCFGQTHPGMIPGQITQNLNWYYTQPGDLVVDLFGGGGSVMDVCHYDDNDFGNRLCCAYDIDPKRPDIEQRDLVKDGVPDVSKAALVFLDPPYGAQKKGEYSEHETNLANMTPADFDAALLKIISSCLEQMKPGARLAVIIGTSQFEGEYNDHAAKLLCEVDAELEMRVIVPYSTEQYQAFDVVRAKNKKKMLNLYRDLMVWRKQ